MEFIGNYIYHEEYGVGNLINYYELGENNHLLVAYMGRTMDLFVNSLEELNKFSSDDEYVNTILDTVYNKIITKPILVNMKASKNILKRGKSFSTQAEALNYVGKNVKQWCNGFCGINDELAACFIYESYRNYRTNKITYKKPSKGWANLFEDKKTKLTIYKDNIKDNIKDLENLRKKISNKQVLVFRKNIDNNSNVFVGIYMQVRNIKDINKRIVLELVDTTFTMSNFNTNSKNQNKVS